MRSSQRIFYRSSFIVVLISRLLIRFIVFYQRFISPLFPRSCRYFPTCSEYMKEALKKYPIQKALFLSLRRILRCHPFGSSGYDPLP